MVHQHEHPGIKFRAYARGQAVAISDLLPMREWRKTGLFSEVCSPKGAQEQLGISSSLSPCLFLAVVVNRTRRTFTDRDHSVLNVLQLHIAEACSSVNIHGV